MGDVIKKRTTDALWDTELNPALIIPMVFYFHNLDDFYVAIIDASFSIHCQIVD